MNKLLWLTLPSIYIETIFHIFRVDHFLRSAVTEGKTKHTSPLRQEENIPKVILTDSKSCAAGRDSGNDKGTCRARGSDARETAGVWKAQFAVPVIALHGGWGGAVCWSGQALARILLGRCWSETHGSGGPSQLGSSMAKPGPNSTLARRVVNTASCLTTWTRWEWLYQGKVSGVGLFPFCSHSGCCT